MYLFNKQSEKALQYFKEKKELTDFMKTAGVDHVIDYAYGIVYTQMNRLDSAEYYFKKSQQRFETISNKANQYYFYVNLGELYRKKNDPKKALDYTLKAKAIAENRADIALLQNVSADLDTIYQMMGDYRNAHAYNKKYHHYKDSLEELSTEKDLLRLEVDNENKRKEREMTAAAEAKRERHNIQYMGITAGIAGVFIVLVMLGAFSVSKATIRIMGFFAFIFLFEFIILLADHAIHDATHGEPWKILAIKIILISILLPLHHFLEKKVIHFLTERKLMEGNAKSLFYKITGKTETDPALKG
jgi:tetratricopeptide (TPR) repeat protein